MEIQWKRFSITTPTPCLRYMPRLTSCGQLRFISRPETDFPVWIWCLFTHLLLSLPIISSSKYSFQHKLWGSLQRRTLGVLSCPTLPHTYTRAKSTPPSIHVGSERPVLLLWLMCTCSSTLWTLGASIAHSTPSQKKTNARKISGFWISNTVLHAVKHCFYWPARDKDSLPSHLTLNPYPMSL